ncbi:MAG: undecaprenyl diphosphate synthase family protein [Armatimonadota bacterium]
MDPQKFKRLPAHIAVIPDGNRRWAQMRGMGKEEGYAYGIQPSVELCEICMELGIGEVTLYGFTQDNTKRPVEQRIAFQQACIEGVRRLDGRDIALLVVGDTGSPMFPPELIPFTTRHDFGKSRLKINFLVNYDWHWDLSEALDVGKDYPSRSRKTFIESIGSNDVSRIDLVIRWGGRRRLSGLLPVQSVYSDFYVLDELWPDFQREQLYEALRWYESQDVTLGG